MRDIQTIFNLIIEENIYDGVNQCFMCNSIRKAYRKKLITKDEKDYSITQINNYLSAHNAYTMTDVVDVGFMGEPGVFETCKSIYLDWINRPMPKNQNQGI